VDIQGFDFQPQSNIQLTVSGVIVSNMRTDDQGQFQTQIFMPVTGEGATSISAYDETGNVATSSFFTEFGFDSIQQTLDSINQTLGGASPVAGAPPTAPAQATPAATTTPAATAPVGPTPTTGAAASPSSSSEQPTAPPLISPKKTPESSGDAAPKSAETNGLTFGGLGLAAGLMIAGLIYGFGLRRRRS